MWAHVAGLALVLAALLPVVGPFGSLSVDEGAAAHQARHLAHERTWTMQPSLRSVPLEHLEFPITKSEETPDGWAPFVRHPLYALGLAALVLTVGPLGMVALSMVGTVLAAAAAGRLAQAMDPGRPAIAAVWAVGIASPLLFDGYLIIAHSLGAAAVGWAACLLIVPSRGRGHIVAGGLLLTVAVLLRTEAVLVGAAIAVVLAVVGRQRTQRRAAIAAGVAAIGTAAGVLLEYAWRRSILATAGVVSGPTGTVDDPDWWANRATGAWRTLLSAGPDGGLIALSVVLVVGGALVLRAGRGRWLGSRFGAVMLMGGVLAAGLSALRSEVQLVPGLLVAAPGLLVAVVVGRRGDVRTGIPRRLAAVALLSMLAIIATQYPEGGSVEWGGRYFAVILPVVAPLVVTSVHRSASDVPGGRLLVIAVVLQAVLLSVVSVRVLAEHGREADRVLADIAAQAVPARTVSAPGDTRPVVVTGDFGPPRLDWRRYEDRRWVMLASPARTTDPQVDALAEDLRPPGRVLLVTSDPDRDLGRLGPHRLVGQPARSGRFDLQLVELLP